MGSLLLNVTVIALNQRRTAKMNQENKERMEGLSNIKDQEQIKQTTKSIIKDLRIDGCDSHDIYEFICELVKEGGN